MRLAKIFIVLVLTASVHLLNAQKDVYISGLDSLKMAQDFNASQIKNSALRSVRDIMLTSPNTFYLKYDRMVVDGISLERNSVFIDGMEVDGGMDFPLRSIGSASHFRFGQPIRYGLQPGSVVVLKSKDPKYHLTTFADGSMAANKGFNDNRIELGLGGPIRFSEDQYSWSPRFYIGGTFHSTNDPFPSWEKKQVLNKGSLVMISQNPLQLTEMGGTLHNASFIYADDLQEVNTHPGADQNSLNYIAKLTVPIIRGMELTVGRYQQIQKGRAFIFANTLMNSAYNPQTEINNSDNYISLKHELNINLDVKLSYMLHFQYADHQFSRLDEKHQDRWFEYGYLGKFKTYKRKTYELGSILIDGQEYDNVWLQNSWDSDTTLSFEGRGYNPLLERYTEMIYELYPDKGDLNAAVGYWRNETDLVLHGGLLNGMAPSPAYGKAPWQNPGTLNPWDITSQDPISAGYGFSQHNKYRGSASASLEIKKHTISLGFEYKKEQISNYEINPRQLWSLMRGMTNYHILDLDLDNPFPVYNNGVFQDTVMFYRSYDANAQFYFDQNLRKKLGLELDGLDYILIDSYDMVNKTIDYYDKNGVLRTISTPASLFDFSMFGPVDLVASGIVSLKGYDPEGNLLEEQPDVFDFFRYGVSGAYQPKTFSAYLSEHFSWKSLDISVGVRIDRFDASQPVLRDPYSLYPILTKGEVSEIQGMPVNQPGSVPDDARVYVDNIYNPSHIMGYRVEDDWYDESGNKIDDPLILDAGSGVSPYLKYPSAEIGSDEWTPEMTFAMYKPNAYILPQVSISYSHRLGFAYFNYSSYSQNPNPTISAYRPEESIFWSYISNGFFHNPALSPTRADKLNFGLRPRIAGNLFGDASYQITAYKNYVWVKSYLGAYPGNYTTFVNLDENVGFNSISLGLMYVNPTNKSLSGSISFTLNSVDYPDNNYLEIPDIVVNSNLLYQFGPTSVLKSDLLGHIVSNLSIGIYHQFRNGTYLPGQTYIQNFEVTPNFHTFNLRVEKGHLFQKSGFYAGIYIYIENLLNAQNLFYIDPVTGKPDDNGYLTGPEWQKEINEQADPESYRLLYQLYQRNPAYYATPRIVKIGVNLKF